ncbi:MAG: hypothetical protein HRF43_02195 [Phycisphaerae bacterium]|jgi:hypothetical protein
MPPLALTSAAAGKSVWESLFSHPSTVPVICTFAMIVLVVCIPAVARYWHKNVKARAEAELKHAMIERGMSVEEIERVLKAGADDE